MPVRWTLTLLFAAVLAGAVVGLAISQARLQRLAAQATSQPPVIILSAADALRAGRDARQIQGLSARLAERGFLVLDAQAVLAAPGALYLSFTEQGNGR